MAESLLQTRRRWPVTTGTSVVFVPDAPIAEGETQAASAHSGAVVTTARLFQYQGWTGPVFVPIDEEPEAFDPANSLAKWLPVWPQPIRSRELHPALVPHATGWPAQQVFDPAKFPHIDQPVVVRRENLIALLTSGGTKPIVRVEINPAMWKPTAPDFVWRTASLYYIPQRSFGPIEPPFAPQFELAWLPSYPPFIHQRKPLHYLVPFDYNPTAGLVDIGVQDITEWLGSYPDFIRDYEPIHFWVPSYFGPDTSRPNQPDEVPDEFVWYLQRPEQTYADKRFPHLIPSLGWRIVGDDVELGGQHIILWRRRRRR